MKQFYIIFLLGGFLTLISSCNNLDSHSIASASEKIEGTWIIQEVKSQVKGDGKLSKKDVTNNYKDWTFTFKSNGEAAIFAPKEDTTFYGSWEIYEDIEYNDEGEVETKNILYMYFWDPDVYDNYREFFWEDMRASNTTLKAVQERDIDGTKAFYHFELTR